MPGDTIALLRYLFTEVLDGRNEGLAHGVREALGRQPRDFADYTPAAPPPRAPGTGRRRPDDDGLLDVLTVSRRLAGRAPDWFDGRSSADRGRQQPDFV